MKILSPETRCTWCVKKTLSALLRWVGSGLCLAGSGLLLGASSAVGVKTCLGRIPIRRTKLPAGIAASKGRDPERKVHGGSGGEHVGRLPKEISPLLLPLVQRAGEGLGGLGWIGNGIPAPLPWLSSTSRAAQIKENGPKPGSYMPAAGTFGDDPQGEVSVQLMTVLQGDKWKGDSVGPQWVPGWTKWAYPFCLSFCRELPVVKSDCRRRQRDAEQEITPRHESLWQSAAWADDTFCMCFRPTVLLDGRPHPAALGELLLVRLIC